MLFNFDLSTVYAKRASNNRPLICNLEVKPRFISCEYNIDGVIAFYVFLRQLENHSPMVTAMHISYNWPRKLDDWFGLACSQRQNINFTTPGRIHDKFNWIQIFCTVLEPYLGKLKSSREIVETH